MKKIMAAVALQWSGNGIFILVLKSKTAFKMSAKSDRTSKKAST